MLLLITMNTLTIIENAAILQSYNIPKHIIGIILDLTKDTCNVCYQTLCSCDFRLCQLCFHKGWRLCAKCLQVVEQGHYCMNCN